MAGVRVGIETVDSRVSPAEGTRLSLNCGLKLWTSWQESTVSAQREHEKTGAEQRHAAFSVLPAQERKTGERRFETESMVEALAIQPPSERLAQAKTTSGEMAPVPIFAPYFRPRGKLNE